jgi:putative endonuclease
VWVLLHLEEMESKRDAMSREWHLKRDRRTRKRIAAGLVSSAAA